MAYLQPFQPFFCALSYISARKPTELESGCNIIEDGAV
jgi:hypothetical protein